MTVILTPLETLSEDSATAIASPAAETAILTTSLVQSGFLYQSTGGQYTITVAQTAVTVAGTVNDIDVEVRQ